MYGSGYNDRKSNNRQFQEAATQRKAANDTQFFWDLVSRHNAGHSVGARKLSKAQEEHFLFHKKSEETSSGIIDDNIPVQRSGPKADEISALDSFNALQDVVPSSILRCVEILKFDQPTPIQKHAIPLGLSGLDLMCCAQTGSGKTLAFLVPVITAIYNRKGDEVPQVIDARGVLPKAIILAPTRELASQIHLDARRLTFGSPLRSVCVYGGNDIRNQLMELCVGADLVVATPGRLNDLVERGIVSLSEVCFLVLDEADRMLDMGFEPQIRRIVLESDMPAGENRQTFMFSATFPTEIQTLAREFLRNYVWIAVGRVGSTVENIKQQILRSNADPQEKIKLLMSVLDQTDGRTLVFVQKRKTASWLCETLRSMFGIASEEIHGDRSQAQRESALKAFRDGNIRILVATDVAARGLDVPAVTHVIQFDMPLSPEDFDVYVHRIGRTGRAGMSGLATSFFVPGREVGEGNGKIAPQLLRLLKENNQDVPDWLEHSDDAVGGYHGHQSNRRGPTNNYNNSNQQRFQQNKFGYSDFRTNQQNFVYPGSSNFYQRGNQQNDAYNHQTTGNPSRGMYGRSQPMMPASVPQNRSMNNFSPAYYSQYNQSPPSMQSFNPAGMQAINGQNPYGQQPAYNGGYYDPYVAAYMTQQGGSMMGNGLENQASYAQNIPMQPQWMVQNASSQVAVPSMHQTAMPPAESDRPQQSNNFMPRADYGGSRQMNGRPQNRNYQGHTDGYSAYSSRQYQNPNAFNAAGYGYGQQRNDYRSRDGYHMQQQQQMRYQDQYRQSNYQNHQIVDNHHDEVALESVEEVQQDQVIDESVNYQSPDQNDVPSVNP